ncbi:MAG TPA: prepilin-type N-terminal cleavage/methylation domain-containing protein [Kofleriaceae bacterium]|nr:prepilin-type N-terminal cleavage/methylation domain-containing protein [Kofleriaceae bacterium]
MARLISSRGRHAENGFTLVELMIVVAVIAVLAVVVVPMFTGEAKKVKAKSEVTAMIAELGTKQERFKNENNVYRAVAACPVTPSSQSQSIASCRSGADWLALGVQSPEGELRCSYAVVVGTSAEDPGTMVPTGATYTVPTGCCATSWYMIHAKCDMDGNGTFSHYISASFDQTMQVTNEGQ